MSFYFFQNSSRGPELNTPAGWFLTAGHMFYTEFFNNCNIGLTAF